MTVATDTAARYAKTFKPGAIVDTPFGTMEAVSFPWAEGDKVYVMMRETPGDATTMQRYQILMGKLVAKNV